MDIIEIKVALPEAETTQVQEKNSYQKKSHAVKQQR
jgi:hypothetical protein